MRRKSPNALPVFLTLLLLGSGAALIALGQRASHPEYSVPSVSSLPTPKKAQTDNNQKSVWARWFEALTNQNKEGAVTPSSNLAESERLPVVINLGAVAARHPAWQLAAALERDPSLPVSLETINVPSLSVNFSSNSAPTIQSSALRAVPPRNLPAPAIAGLENDLPYFAPPTTDKEAQTVIASGILPLQDEAKSRQSSELDVFLNTAAQRQQSARAEAAEINLTALEEEIDVARRLRLDGLETPLLSDPIQLQMINLRLQLLQNVFSTPAERDIARKELERLEEEWRRRLQRQAEERVAQLLALQQEQDRREQKSRSRFAATLIDKNERDTQARVAIRRAHESRVNADFMPENATLGIVLPAVAGSLPDSPASTTVSGTGSTQSQSTPRRIIPNTAKNRPVTLPPLPNGNSGVTRGGALSGGTVESTTNRAAVIQALRARAYRESRRWSRMVMRSNNWNWVQNENKADVIAADKTAEVISVLSFD